MSIDKAKLRAFAERLVSEHQAGKGDPVPAIGVPAADVLALLAEIEKLEAAKHTVECRFEVSADTLSTIRGCLREAESDIDQLKAENERLSTENSEIESAAITYIEDMQEAQRENARLTELFTVGMTLDGNLRVYGDWQSVRKAQEILAERDQLRAEVAGLRTGYEAYERVNAELKAEVEGLREANDKLTRRNGMLEQNVEVMTKAYVLYTWLRKKCDQPSNDQVAVQMNIGHDWVPVHDLDRDLRTMIDREEP